MNTSEVLKMYSDVSMVNDVATSFIVEYIKETEKLDEVVPEFESYRTEINRAVFLMVFHGSDHIDRNIVVEVNSDVFEVYFEDLTSFTFEYTGNMFPVINRLHSWYPSKEVHGPLSRGVFKNKVEFIQV